MLVIPEQPRTNMFTTFADPVNALLFRPHPDTVHGSRRHVRRRGAEHMVRAILELKASNDDLTDALKAANDNIKDVREYFEAYKEVHRQVRSVRGNEDFGVRDNSNFDS